MSYKKKYFPRREIIFQHDNAPAHRAFTTKTWFANQQGISLIQWPPNSPDLNPIEHDWQILKKEIRKKITHTLQVLKH